MLWRATGGFLIVLLLAGCVAGSAPRSGFLRDYSGLEPVGNSKSLAEQRPPADFDLRRYVAVVIDEPLITVEELSEEDKRRLADVFRRALVAELNGALPVTDRLGPGVLRVRTAIVSARKANVPVNVLTSLVAVPLTRGGVAAEAEVIDGGTGRRIAALSWARSGAKITQPGLSYTRLGEARAGLRAFARRLMNLITTGDERSFNGQASVALIDR